MLQAGTRPPNGPETYLHRIPSLAVLNSIRVQEYEYLQQRVTMHPTSILISLFSLALALPNPSPDLSFAPPGLCATAGQFVCVSKTSFAICDDFLVGSVQELASGDMRCSATTNSAPPPPPPASVTTPPPPAKTYHKSKASVPPPPETLSVPPSKNPDCHFGVASVNPACVSDPPTIPTDG
ncbi:hypothetical protein H2200_004957 [Cladophialophora chaetospira]|uniref:Uncharacterized protein n=1 Tax=Cladophialophora chaetospira TaxID=386627 RepID=A0AA38XE23_9EURO|nr:hypothetical protein H2200_004957 [Cladophialophora chaetospira]